MFGLDFSFSTLNCVCLVKELVLLGMWGDVNPIYVCTCTTHMRDIS